MALDPRPSLRFHFSEELRDRLLAVLAAIETSADPTRYRTGLAEAVIELTECGLAEYFVRPVVAARAGLLAEQATKLGVASTLRLMGPAARRVIGGLDASGLRSLASHLRQMME